MASIKKRRGQYYSRVQWYSDLNKRMEKQIPLKTNKKSEAVVRNNAVEKVEDLIKLGENCSFPWMNEGGKTKFIRLSFSDAFQNYMAVKRLEGLRPKTYQIIETAITSFMNKIGYSVPVELITESHINEWKDWSMRNQTPETTNIYLAKLNTFLTFCRKKNYIKREIEIDKLKVDKKPPMYLSDEKIVALMNDEETPKIYRVGFLFYIATGCRLAEPFEGTLQGNWLIIEPENAKTHKTREVELDKHTLNCYAQMMDHYNSRIGKSMNGTWSNSHKGIIDTYSKEFKKSAKRLGFGKHKFHNTRDTYAVRRWAETGDIYLVSKEIGHTSVTMTQKYANFNLRRLAVDFPSLQKKIELRLDKSASNESLLRLVGMA